jgi:glycosyltransferase involved in cell wall biosynthesis
MKLIIQIPCYNEAKTIGDVLQELPKEIPWIDTIETMIIDDGCTDNTVNVAKQYQVRHIVQYIGNKWLWAAFRAGLEKALVEGADILVNTDGDNQYPGKYISELVQPIIAKKADIVMGDRQTKTIKHFSFVKKIFQYLWSALVRYFSGVDVPDSVSGFRAYSRESLLQLNVTSKFSYAVDTLVQAGNKSLKVEYIKITTNKPTRPSRLFKNMFEHMTKTFTILMRVYTMYNPMKIFFTLGMPFFLIGTGLLGRFLYYFIVNPTNTGKVQSLVIAWVFLIIATQFFALGIIGDLIAKNRKLIEDNLYFTKKSFFEKK